jgi:hypothetical protein
VEAGLGAMGVEEGGFQGEGMAVAEEEEGVVVK